MIEDFEMQSELQGSCVVNVNKRMNYDPKIDGPVVISNSEAHKIQAFDSNEIVVGGKLIKK